MGRAVSARGFPMMPVLGSLLALLLAASPAPRRPDVVFEQTTTTAVDGKAGEPVKSRVFWSGRRVRLEAGDAFDPLVLLVDLDRDHAFRLQPGTKKATRLDLARLRSQAHLDFSMAGDRMGADEEDAFRTQPLPGRRTVAGYACDGYRIRGRKTRMDVWIARRAPVGMDLFTELLEWSGADQSLAGLLPEMQKLPGFPLETRSRVASGGHVYETQATIMSFKVEPLAAALFTVPVEYRVEEEPEAAEP